MTIDNQFLYVRETEAALLPPPRRETGIVYWLRSNLFSSTGNSLLTVLTVIFLAWLLPFLYNFLIGHAVFSGTMEDCRVPGVGACWIYIQQRASFMTYGFYPIVEYLDLLRRQRHVSHSARDAEVRRALPESRAGR